MRQLRVGRVCPNSQSWIEEKLGCQPPVVPTQQGKALSTGGHGSQPTQFSTALFGGGVRRSRRTLGKQCPLCLSWVERPAWAGLCSPAGVCPAASQVQFPGSSTAASDLWTLAQCTPVRRRRLLSSSRRGYSYSKGKQLGLSLRPATPWLSGSLRPSGSLWEICWLNT